MSALGSTLSGLLDLNDRLAVVTGAAMGLGADVATMLAEQRAVVALIDLDQERAQAHATLLVSRGLRCHAFAADVSNGQQVNSAIKSIRAELGPIDCLVNAAGVVSAPGMPFTNNTEQDFDRTFAVNVKGMFATAKACHDDLVASRSGRVVNLSSITGVISAAYMPAYSVSKAAVISLTKVMARDFAPHHVTANAVCPGFIWTPLWAQLGQVMARAEGSADPARDARAVFDQRIDAHVPMKRPQTGLDVAAMVAFLCSDAAANITGQVIGVDGGITI